MAVLSPIHWETITPAMHAVLRFLGQCSFSERFYLAGGTALALRLGHRRSVDLDLFSVHDELNAPARLEILSALSALAPLALEDVGGNLLLDVQGLHVGFFSYGYRLLGGVETVGGVALAGLLDLGLMKLDALIDRGSRKDFVDIFVIAQQVPLADLLSRARDKYPYARDFDLMAVESLVSFENADRDLEPDMLIDLQWEDVRDFFVAQARALGETWFGAQG